MPASHGCPEPALASEALFHAHVRNGQQVSNGSMPLIGGAVALAVGAEPKMDLSGEDARDALVYN